MQHKPPQTRKKALTRPVHSRRLFLAISSSCLIGLAMNSMNIYIAVAIWGTIIFALFSFLAFILRKLIGFSGSSPDTFDDTPSLDEDASWSPDRELQDLHSLDWEDHMRTYDLERL